MERDAPVFVVRNGATDKRSRRLAFLQVAEAGDTEEIAGAGPQRLARQQTSLRRVAGVGHRRLYLDPIRSGAERIRGRDRDLAPVARRPDDDLLRAALEDVHLLVGVGPRRPVVRNEVGEDDSVACRLAAHDGSEVDDCAARHAIGHGALDGECERESLVHHRDVARGGGFAVGDRCRPDDHLQRRARGTRLQCCDQQREEGRARRKLLHDVSQDFALRRPAMRRR